jgi:hypothetical protein
MAKVESVGAGLLPAIALAAAVLSGNLFKPSGGLDDAKPSPPSRQTEATADSAASGDGWADMRPVLELLGQALGVSVERREIERNVLALLSNRDLEQGLRNEPVKKALQSLEDALHWNPAWGHFDRRRLANRSIEDVDAILDNLTDDEALNRLTGVVRRGVEQRRALQVDVQFLVVTIPDYVDSNIGWVADETISAIQSAMSSAGYLLDRFRLIDWSRVDPQAETQVSSESRLHERRPGALIFRRIDLDRKELTYQVVLLALETPTAGVHRVALKNALAFVREWNRRALLESERRTLRVVGPIFSGSVASLASEIRDWQADGKDRAVVVTGSAMADENSCIFSTLAPAASYQAAVQPTSVVMEALAETLGTMNRDWRSGKHVALLAEGNTLFGSTAVFPSPGQHARHDNGCDLRRAEAFRAESVFSFPLHIARLRSDAQRSASTPLPLLPTPIVPLNMRETTPPADQLPALRPQLTSPAVEAMVDSIVDDIRHRHISAVGILASDSRDALFLAREVKRGAPDVQLFIVGNHLLPLHREFIPYTRGALVASPYSLAFHQQRFAVSPRGEWSPPRLETFPGQVAEGVFNATLIQLSRPDKLLDYCDPGADVNGSGEIRCAPPAWVSVVGDDGYWPLARKADYSKVMYTVQGIPRRETPRPLPTTAGLIGLTLIVIAGGHGWCSRYLAGALRSNPDPRRFLRWPILRILAPPITQRTIAAGHSVVVLMCLSVLAALVAWCAVVFALHILLGFGLLNGVTRIVAAVAGALVLYLVISQAWTLLRVSSQIDTLQFLDEHQRAAIDDALSNLTPGRRIFVGIGAALIVGSLLSFIWFIGHTALSSDESDVSLRVARILGGGIVSPAPVAICLFGALYAGMFAVLRRLSLVGCGYTALAKQSAVYRLFGGDTMRNGAPPNPGPGSLGAILDVPMQNLPPAYLLGIIGVTLCIAWSLQRLTTIDGPAFSIFLTIASLTVLFTAAMQLAQAAATWKALRSKLTRLGRTSLAPALGTVATAIRWEFSIVPPRLSELVPLASGVDRLRAQLVKIAGGSRYPPRRNSDVNAPEQLPALEDVIEPQMPLRTGDFAELAGADDWNGRPQMDALTEEIKRQKHAPLLQSSTWSATWRISNTLVELLERVHWTRDARPDLIAHDPSQTVRNNPALVRWFDDCERIVALQFAFLLRDVIARIMSSLFTAMLCLTLLTLAHLVYLFQGRSSALTVDLLAIAVTSVVAIWILVGMEREMTLRRMRSTTPGRIDFNWDFVRRVGMYGVLPLVAVIASLFPEIGDSLFGWVEPLRKIATF